MTPKVFSIMETLEAAGYAAYIAGGAVRDHILGIEHNDCDIATSASPEVVQELFPEGKLVSSRAGVPLTMLGDIEVATFRREEGKRSQVRTEITTCIREDAMRRDLTVNALYMNRAGFIVDPTGMGLSDLEEGVLRFVGDPTERIREDPTRMFRICRFVGKLPGFKIARDSSRAICEYMQAVFEGRELMCAEEQIARELMKILSLPAAHITEAFDALLWTDILEVVLPELSDMYALPQNEHHLEGDVWTHTMMVLENLSPGADEETRMAALLHDIGKGDTQEPKEGKPGQYTFINHEKVGATMAEDLLNRLKFPKKFTEDVCWMISQHMRVREVMDMKKSKQAALYRDVRFPKLLQLLAADNLGKIPQDTEGHIKIKSAWTNFLDNDVTIHQRGICGKLLMDYFHLSPGPEVGQMKERANVILLENPEITNIQLLKQLKEERKV